MRENQDNRKKISQSGPGDGLTCPLLTSVTLFSLFLWTFTLTLRSSSAGPSAALHLSSPHLPLFLSALVSPVSLSGYFFFFYALMTGGVSKSSPLSSAGSRPSSACLPPTPVALRPLYFQRRRESHRLKSLHQSPAALWELPQVTSERD